MAAASRPLTLPGVPPRLDFAIEVIVRILGLQA
jgi:hypothetical protein